ncbi:MAG: nitrate ABC transporter permease [Firmicutes bacterium]|nr:nitrate ABC transporter permease [Bacillota bacterium]MBQ5961303.1 nitrate ABC transporter permease [Bacillota bacterium]
MDKTVRKVLILLFWLAAWQLVSILTHNSIVLAGPWETLTALFGMIRTGEYWRSVGFTMLRIFLGLFAGIMLGVLGGLLSGRYPKTEEFLSLPVTVVKAVPVVSFIIMVIIWAGNRDLAFWISLLVVMPYLYFSTLAGWKTTDRRMLEMAGTFHMPAVSRARYIYFPTLYPFLKSALQTAVGMAWKSGVAAEVIGQPLASIGNGLYRSKIFLETDAVFAWTISIILFAWLSEKLLLGVFGLLRPGRKYGI